MNTDMSIAYHVLRDTEKNRKTTRKPLRFFPCLYFSTCMLQTDLLHTNFDKINIMPMTNIILWPIYSTNQTHSVGIGHLNLCGKPEVNCKIQFHCIYPYGWPWDHACAWCNYEELLPDDFWIGGNMICFTINTRLNSRPFWSASPWGTELCRKNFPIEQKYIFQTQTQTSLFNRISYQVNNKHKYTNNREFLVYSMRATRYVLQICIKYNAYNFSEETPVAWGLLASVCFTNAFRFYYEIEALIRIFAQRPLWVNTVCLAVWT